MESFYGEIPVCRGVYANAKSLEKRRKELEETLEEWILFRIHKHLSIPVKSDVENTSFLAEIEAGEVIYER